MRDDSYEILRRWHSCGCDVGNWETEVLHAADGDTTRTYACQAHTGLTHLGAREYAPSLGRFLSLEPGAELRVMEGSRDVARLILDIEAKATP